MVEWENHSHRGETLFTASLGVFDLRILDTGSDRGISCEIFASDHIHTDIDFYVKRTVPLAQIKAMLENMARQFAGSLHEAGVNCDV